ncbi:DoxX family protein [Nonomuraea angiospora]|uniref:DoxX family protein n=1 Tax=Nonomuraea angiospora TaxID=46172 RepID=UPI003F53E93F
MNVVLWIVQAVLAAMFGMAGVMKSTQPKDKLAPRLPWVEDFSAGTVRFIGIAEPAGALGLILPRGATPSHACHRLRRDRRHRPPARPAAPGRRPPGHRAGPHPAKLALTHPTLIILAGQLSDTAAVRQAITGADAVSEGELLAGLVPAHRDNPFGAELSGGQHAERPDGAVADDRDGLARSHLCGHRGEPSCTQYVGGGQEAGGQVLRRYVRRGDQGAIRERDAHELRLGAADALTVDAGRRQADDRIGRLDDLRVGTVLDEDLSGKSTFLDRR